jgi:hypothetical protein
MVAGDRYAVRFAFPTTVGSAPMLLAMASIDGALRPCAAQLAQGYAAPMMSSAPCATR